ncbi:hypothetical protein PHLGIDRAFT_344201 [Phlebiopsis gigantea 11061_1 CR5-6]|uniref:Secreted protein n=1 Tax=Phlebiopsis gigantea (strain 11061_1 CR5-6) TaxID=745531 RepID=A0A0C3PA36_PHLG1|nr:hypothetical protein PHLGIDRAFT_344201 [Phlebiopsis gigantea 11061_1 CR5-6]
MSPPCIMTLPTTVLLALLSHLLVRPRCSARPRPSWPVLGCSFHTAASGRETSVFIRVSTATIRRRRHKAAYRHP